MIIIQAKSLRYGLDFCSAFWDWLSESNAAGRIFSVEQVYFEYCVYGSIPAMLLM